MVSADPRFQLTFQLTAHGDTVEVRARGPGGECRAESKLPSQDHLDKFLLDATEVPASVLQSVGRTLYRCLAANGSADLISSVCHDAWKFQKPAHFELRFDPDQALLAQFPWELVADREGRFLVRDGWVDVSRYIAYPQPPPALGPLDQNLPVLQVISQPAGFPPLGATRLFIDQRCCP